ncbi:MAG TPA: hypothetical protein VFV38_13380 [Ktedonobacteraceae bacterium]|nr:hypothetical protein [Ktedonobacteraceae bacterium]
MPNPPSITGICVISFLTWIKLLPHIEANLSNLLNSYLPTLIR